MSTIKVNDIQEATSGGGKIFPARAWVNFNGSASIQDHGGVSSVTDNGTGHWTVNFSNSFSNSGYSINGSAQWTPGVNALSNFSIRSLATDSAVVDTANSANGAKTDSTITCCNVNGDG
jgi:hypothetical protein